MSISFFPRLAWTGIRRNKRLYTPYLLTCLGMVMMLYIITALSFSPMLESMRGGTSTQFVLRLGTFVISVFSLIFLFYTNSFLIRRRNREFGLYNVLGMDKRGISRIIAWESLLTAVIALAGGLILGVAFSKLAELGLLRALDVDVSYDLFISWQAVGQTALTFAVIFTLIFLNSLRLVQKSDPLALMRSESAGEKPPRANWIGALIGVLLLGGAYFLAATIQSPLQALLLFFVAVIMVIIATYLLLIAGSVVLCRVLQKRKGYYYKANHFVSVSSMVYRMKRNGAGLASVCILCTMVLVMLSSTFSLFLGSEDSLRSRYPRDICMTVQLDDQLTDSHQALALFDETAAQSAAQVGVTPQNAMAYRYATSYGVIRGNLFTPDEAALNGMNVSGGQVCCVLLVPMEDYNRISGTDYQLEPGQAMIWCAQKMRYTEDSLRMGELTLAITGQVSDAFSCGDASASLLPCLYVFVEDYDSCVTQLTAADSAEDTLLSTHCFCGFDADVSQDRQIALKETLIDRVAQLDADDLYQYYSVSNRAENRSDFNATYGGLFFIGIILSIVFVSGAVLIIYYKQVSEGFEDRPRFSIMQKVGMTDGAIRKSINSQILTVFFAPLLLSGLHLGFACPMVWKLLQLFNLQNPGLFLTVTACAYLVFAVFYAIVYRLTSNAYYTLVSRSEEHGN